MCYPKPGPRCAAHARETLSKARTAYEAAGEEERAVLKADLEQAVSDYNETKTGVRELRSQAKALKEEAEELTKEGKVSEAAAHRRLAYNLQDQADDGEIRRKEKLAAFHEATQEKQAQELPPSFKHLDLDDEDIHETIFETHNFVSLSDGEFTDIGSESPREWAERQWGDGFDCEFSTSIVGNTLYWERTTTHRTGEEYTDTNNFHTWEVEELSPEQLRTAEIYDDGSFTPLNEAALAVAWRLSDSDEQVANAILPKLANSSSTSVREAVAKHPKAPVGVLAMLASEDESMLEIVKANPNFSKQKLLKHLFPDTHKEMEDVPLSWLLKATAA